MQNTRQSLSQQDYSTFYDQAVERYMVTLHTISVCWTLIELQVLLHQTKLCYSTQWPFAMSIK